MTGWAGAVVVRPVVHDLHPGTEARWVAGAVGGVRLKDHVPRVDAKCVVAEVAAVPRVVADVVPDVFAHLRGGVKEEHVLPDSSAVATNGEVRVEVGFSFGQGATGPARQVALVKLMLRLEREEAAQPECDVDDLVPFFHRVRVLVFLVIQRRSWIVERPRGAEHLGYLGS